MPVAGVNAKQRLASARGAGGGGGGGGGTFPTMTAEQVRGLFGTRVFPMYVNRTGGEMVVGGTEALNARRVAAQGFLTGLKPGYFTHKISDTMSSAVISFIQDMSENHGIKSVLTVGEPHTEISSAEWTAMADYLKGPLAGHVLMVSGWNEVNNVRDAAHTHTVTRKQLTSNVVKLTFGDVTSSNPNNSTVGQGIRVSDMGAPFNGTFTITAKTSSTLSYRVTGSNIDVADTAVSSGTLVAPILPPDWKQQTGAMQGELWTRVNGTNGVNASLVAAGKPKIQVGMAVLHSGDLVGHFTDLEALAPFIKGKFDAITWHLYPRGQDPNGVDLGSNGTTELDFWFKSFQDLFGTNLPVWCTEAGYLTAPKYTGGAANVKIETAAIYLEKMILEWSLRQATGAAPKTYIGQFELIGDPDPTQADREKNLGMILPATDTVDATKWTARTTYTRIKNGLMALSGGTAGAVDVTVTVPGTDPVQGLAIKTSGGTKLYLWRRGRIESSTGTLLELSPKTVTATVVTPGGTRTVDVGREPVSINI